MQLHSMGPFSLEQIRRQRKTGGCKNTYVIILNLRIIYNQFTEKDHAEILSYLNKQAGPSKGNGWIFTKREQAEKAWVYLTLKWC